MYCSNCQKQRKKGDLYCEDCGQKLKHQIMPMKVSKKTVTVIAIFVIVLFSLIGLYEIGSSINSPASVAKRYFKAIVEENTDEIYSILDREDSLFYSKELLKEKSENIQAEDYQVKSVRENEKYAEVLFTYTDKNQVKTASIILKKDGSQLFLYDNWKVESAKVAENVIIKVLKGSTLTVDNKNVSSYQVTSENEYYDTYKIPIMVAGEYQFKATLPNGLTMDKKFSVSSNQTYTLSYLTLEDTMKETLGNSAIQALNQLYSSAIANKTYKSIASNFKLSLENIYDSLKEQIHLTEIQTIQFSDPSIKTAYLNEIGNLEILLTVDYSIKEKGSDATNHSQSYIMEYQYVDSSFVLKNIKNWRLR